MRKESATCFCNFILKHTDFHSFQMLFTLYLNSKYVSDWMNNGLSGIINSDLTGSGHRDSPSSSSLYTFLKLNFSVPSFFVCRAAKTSTLRSYTPSWLPALTCSLLGADSRTLQVGGLNEDGGGVQSVGRKSIKAVLRQPGGDGDLMLSFTGGCGGIKHGDF